MAVEVLASPVVTHRGAWIGVAGSDLASLLGRTRAALLESLAEPASTHTLARRHGLAPSTVSEHLTVLHDARLVIRRRHRHAVIYQQAPLGTELAQG